MYRLKFCYNYLSRQTFCIFVWLCKTSFIFNHYEILSVIEGTIAKMSAHDYKWKDLGNEKDVFNMIMSSGSVVF